MAAQQDKIVNTTKRYPENTAGGKMVTSVPYAKIGESVAHIQEMLIKKAKDFRTLDYIYVVNGSGVLRGVVSVKEVLQAPKRARIEKIMKRKTIAAHSMTHQERVVYLAMKYNIKAVPVVDKDGHMLGIVPYNTILDIFHTEAQEDIMKLAGVQPHNHREMEVCSASCPKMLRARLPWLIFGLLGGVLAANVVGFFESTLSAYLSLAMFIPVLVYMSDAVGTQTETLFIRSIALNPKLQIRNYILRECKVGLLIAVVCGLMLSVIAIYGWGPPLFGVIVGTAMFFGIVSAVIIATLFPWLLKKLKTDPAMGSGPFATVVTDITTLFIYFSIASLLIKYFV